LINYLAITSQRQTTRLTTPNYGSTKKLVKCFPFALKKHVAVTFCLQNVQLLWDFPVGKKISSHSVCKMSSF